MSTLYLKVFLTLASLVSLVLMNCTKAIVSGPFVLFGNIISLSSNSPHLHLQPTSAPCWYLSKTISVCHYLSLPQCLLWRLTVSEQSNSRSIIIDLVTILTLSVTSCCTKLTGSTQDQSRFNQQKLSFEGGNLSLVTGDLAQGNSLLKDELRIKENSHCGPTFIARAEPPGYPK